MNIIKGKTKFNTKKDIYLQRSFIESDDGNLLCKIITCVTEEFFKYGSDIKDDKQIEDWINKETDRAFLEYKIRLAGGENIEVMIKAFPQIQALYNFGLEI